MEKIYIHNIDIVTGYEVIRNGSLMLDEGLIAGVFRQPVPVPDGMKVVDGQGCIAVPGFIDVHCHGGNGFDTNDGTVEAIDGLASYHLQHGVTSVYPTLSTDSFDRLLNGLDAVRLSMTRNMPGRPEIMGAHLEGPFLNTKYKGSQAGKYFLSLNDDYLSAIEKYKDVIRRITIAPEIVGLEYIRLLCRMGMVVSGGHSDATCQQVREAADAGMSSLTHLFNAMSQVHKEGPFRVCGMVEAGLTSDSLYAEVIADGYHVPVPLMQIAYRCKGAGRLMICSDANMASGGQEGNTFQVYGQTYVIENGVALNAARTSLAGSVMSLDAMFRNLVLSADIPVTDAVKMASTTPAKMMNIDDRKGSVAIGKDADIILLSAGYQIQKVFCRGVPIDH